MKKTTRYTVDPVQAGDPDAEKRRQIAAALLGWYRQVRRDLPWRRQRDPYAIWVSEVMLQQTRVDTVIPYYERWMQQFPDPVALAEAAEDDVLKAWEGLGYYSRARNLQAAARELTAEGGQVPDDPVRFAALPGVGPYTVGAVLSIAYDRPLPAVDGNVMRVLSRLYRIGADVAKPNARRIFEPLAAGLIPPGAAGDFNQALMELGALVCTPGKPRCQACPVSTWCVAREAGCETELPVKSRAKPPKPMEMAVALVRWGDRVLVVRRPAEGLLGGLWEFPTAQIPVGTDGEAHLQQYLADHFGLRVITQGPAARLKHTFTHLVWQMTAYPCLLTHDSPFPRERADLHWAEVHRLGEYAFPVAYQKLAAGLHAGQPRFPGL